jgi:hypothetical protein
MILRRLIPCLCAAAFTTCLTAQEPKPDKELAALETRLQAERAAAIHARLVLYSDELEKLEAQYTAASDTFSASAVQQERTSVGDAMKRLASIADGKIEPAEPDELKPKEVLDNTALAARRIDAIIARFSRARSEPDSAADTSSPPGQPGRRTLRMDNKVVKNREHAKLEGSAYWAYDNSYAVWSVNDLAPGEYEVVLRYTGSKSGGKATVKIAKQVLDVIVPTVEKGQSKFEPITAGTVKITERGADVRVESGGRAKGADYLWNLQSLTLVPVPKRP